MFGRRKKQEEQEQAREAERRKLFEELAKRPDTVCPFLGLESARTEYRDRVADGHRCYAFGDPAELSAEQQTKVCLQRGYGNCPRYLRGVLVIPTEELEALRRPQPAPPPVAPEPEPAPTGGGRRGLVAILLVLLLAVGGGGVAFLALGGPGGVAQETPSPTAQASAPASVPASGEPSAPPSTPATPTLEPTPVIVPSDAPTPGPSDTPTGFAIRLQAGNYPAVIMEPDGTIVDAATSTFDGPSWAPVSRIVVDGDVYWRTLAGGYTGRAYSRALSSGFVVYETFETSTGEARFRPLDEDEY